jgi:hypothetical protein
VVRQAVWAKNLAAAGDTDESLHHRASVTPNSGDLKNKPPRFFDDGAVCLTCRSAADQALLHRAI